MFELEIRQAESIDVHAIADLLDQLGYDTAEAKIENFLSVSSAADSSVSVCVLKRRVIAVMSVIYFNYFPSAEKICRITSIVVDRQSRGLGVGSKLIDYAKENAIAGNCDVLELTTSLRREKAQRYYEKIGFQKTSYKYILRLVTND